MISPSRETARLCPSLLLAAILLPIGLFAQTVADSFSFPLARAWSPTQDFRAWYNSGSVGPGFHLGEDVSIPVPPGGTPKDTEVPVFATGNGHVKHVGQHAGYGWVVIIEHQLPSSDPLAPIVTTLSAHLRKEGLIGVGVDVPKEQIIGYLSSDPNENGGYPYTHLHFAVRKGGFVEGCDPVSNWWVYAGYSTLFGSCNDWNTRIISTEEDPRHAIVVSNFSPPSTFISDRLHLGPLIFSNIGEDGTYQSGLRFTFGYEAWLNRTVSVAFPFTPTGNYRLTRLELGIAPFDQGGTVKVELRTDLNGQPGDTLESWLTNMPQSGALASPCVAMSSVSNPALTFGQQYWLVSTAAAGGGTGQWYTVSNDYSIVARSIDGGPWSTVQTFRGAIRAYGVGGVQ